MRSTSSLPSGGDCRSPAWTGRSGALHKGTVLPSFPMAWRKVLFGNRWHNHRAACPPHATTLTERAMSNETDFNPAEAPPEAANEDLPPTTDQLMQAATARIAALEAEAAEMKDRWMRAEAETANVRARAQREINETRQYAVQKFAQDVVEAAENLH